MIKDHSVGERGNLLPPLPGLLFLISSKGSFIYTIPQSAAVLILTYRMLLEYINLTMNENIILSPWHSIAMLSLSRNMK